MAKIVKPKDDEEFAKSVRKQFDGLFSGEDVPPAPINIRQMQELQTRIKELEVQLKSQGSSISVPPDAQQAAAVVVPQPATAEVPELSKETGQDRADSQKEVSLREAEPSIPTQAPFAGHITASGLFGAVERQVEERTRGLELASAVGRAISVMTADINVLLKQAVELIRESFGLYYTQIYLMDSTGQKLILRAGTGEVGEQLIRRGHQLPVGPSSLNGRAASEKHSVIVSNTSRDTNFLPNPLLPNTRSEMAVPLLAGGQVVGVLDMQGDEIDALSESKLPAFEALAGQLAVTIQNASLFVEIEQARLDVEAQVRRLTERGWDEFLDGIERGQRIGFAFDQRNVLPVEDDALPESSSTNMFRAPITVTGEQVGVIQLVDEPERTWTDDEAEIIKATARQLAQHLENLRLLAQAERYRENAEQAARLLTREGWEEYLKSHREQIAGYAFDLNKVQPLAEGGNSSVRGEFKYPLVVRDEAIGELAVDSVNQSDEMAEIVAVVSQQLSEHIENLRLTERTQSALSETETLYKASAAMNSATSYDQIMEVLRSYTLLGHNAQNVSLNFFDRPWTSSEEPTWIKTLARWTQMPPETTLNQYTLSAFPSARQLLHPDSPTLIEDVANDPRLDNNARRLYAEQFGGKSTIFIPLVVGGQWLGYINGIYQQATSFPEDEVRELMTLAGQAAVAINNIRLLTLTQERVKREQALREITTALRSSTNPTTIMRTAVQELGNTLGRKTIISIDPAKQGIVDKKVADSSPTRATGGKK